MKLLTVDNLRVYDTRSGQFLVNGVNFSLQENTCLGIVGESGSGKSLTCKALMGLLAPGLRAEGEAVLEGKSLLQASEEELRQVRGRRIAMIMQDAMTAFDPLYTLGAQMVETLQEKMALSSKDALDVAVDSLEKMCLRETGQVVKKYPYQLSGGMLQRCMIALTLALQPDIIIADEPTTALDSINQREVIEEFQRLREMGTMSLVFISHDLGIVQRLAQEVLVMCKGEQVEYGPAADVFGCPQHAYTRYLVDTRRELTQFFRESMKERCG